MSETNGIETEVCKYRSLNLQNRTVNCIAFVQRITALNISLQMSSTRNTRPGVFSAVIPQSGDAGYSVRRHSRGAQWSGQKLLSAMSPDPRFPRELLS